MNACNFPQTLVNQSPKYDNQIRKRKCNGNQVVSKKTGIIRPDKRKKAHYI